MAFSKSRYCRAVQCPKMLWLIIHKPELFDEGVLRQSVMDNGREVGELARSLFGIYHEITFAEDKQQMLLDTAYWIGRDAEVIAEAAFAYEDCFCLADLFRQGERGWELFEVKSSTSIKDTYLDDLAYQYYVIQNAGFPIEKASLVIIDNSYTRQGNLSIQELFSIQDLTRQVQEMQPQVEQNILAYRDLLKQPEPGDYVGENCFKPYNCGFWSYCTRHLPSPNVFDLHGERVKQKLACYRDGVHSFELIMQAQPKLLKNSYQQVRWELEQCPPFIDRPAIRRYLEKLYFPLCFLDFETINPAIPPFNNTRPYMQFPTQYSLHVQEREGAPLKHYEFLGEPGEDPRAELVEQLCRDVPKGACILAYNAAFEKGVIGQLAECFPRYHKRLTSMIDCMQDLMIPFKNRAYYNRNQKGSYSIKYVLPALFPDDPELDYHSLEGVHNGTEAMGAYEVLGKLSPEQRDEVRKQLLEYCKLDTLAMVRIWEKLRGLCGFED